MCWNTLKVQSYFGKDLDLAYKDGYICLARKGEGDLKISNDRKKLSCAKEVNEEDSFSQLKW
ncbi:hypothetical protein C4D60_Mb06t18440 [Musa balbisiana]|uniref:Uncharacterized protein n=1 Tax=Musa balbisiana TaxID=52838 RepID=A0A4S8IRG2_MUSBA|nr:hypothetical protein C4D60_Mb06t18440 [Musa balbisiana]